MHKSFFQACLWVTYRKRWFWCSQKFSQCIIFPSDKEIFKNHYIGGIGFYFRSMHPSSYPGIFKYTLFWRIYLSVRIILPMNKFPERCTTYLINYLPGDLSTFFVTVFFLLVFASFLVQCDNFKNMATTLILLASIISSGYVVSQSWLKLNPRCMRRQYSKMVKILISGFKF